MITPHEIRIVRRTLFNTKRRVQKLDAKTIVKKRIIFHQESGGNVFVNQAKPLSPKIPATSHVVFLGLRILIGVVPVWHVFKDLGKAFHERYLVI